MRFPGLAAVLTILTVPLFAEQPDRSGWQYDAIMPDHVSDDSSPTATDINAINDLLAKMADRWNAHDLDGYLSVYWNSPRLLVVSGDDQVQGWQALHDAFKVDYRDSNTMGAIQYSRIQVKFSKPDLALAKTSWSIAYPNSKGNVVGDTPTSVHARRCESLRCPCLRKNERANRYASDSPIHSGADVGDEPNR